MWGEILKTWGDTGLDANGPSATIYQCLHRCERSEQHGKALIAEFLRTADSAWSWFVVTNVCVNLISTQVSSALLKSLQTTSCRVVWICKEIAKKLATIAEAKEQKSLEDIKGDITLCAQHLNVRLPKPQDIDGRRGQSQSAKINSTWSPRVASWKHIGQGVNRTNALICFNAAPRCQFIAKCLWASGHQEQVGQTGNCSRVGNSYTLSKDNLCSL